ncbi:MAG: SOS response-associated peptidase [Methylobacteriaceae bacterium]|nr:SOS response-associated peptidase [Methylobacteriaceae bacterium]
MCARVIQARDPTLYASLVAAAPGRPLPNAPARYNGAPSQDFLVGRREPRSGERSLDLLRWGLIPVWAKDKTIAWKTINARAETLATSALFKGAYAKRRCLVPVDGFYEWRTVGKLKQPYLFAPANDEPFTLAGLWESWKDPATGEWLRTFTIVTTRANAIVSPLHDRMPVIIAAADRDRWLDDPEPGDLLAPYPAELMRRRPVSREVNSVKNEGSHLPEETADPSGSLDPDDVATANSPDALESPANSD